MAHFRRTAGGWLTTRTNRDGRKSTCGPLSRLARRARRGGGRGPVAGIHRPVESCPSWRSDGKELYYLNPDGAMMAAPITVTGTTLEPGAPVMLFPTRIFGGGADIQQGRQYDVTPDGRFLINTLLNEAAAPITLLQNWNPEAKK